MQFWFQRIYQQRVQSLLNDVSLQSVHIHVRAITHNIGKQQLTFTQTMLRKPPYIRILLSVINVAIVAEFPTDVGD